MTFQVTVELSPDDRAIFTRLARALENSVAKVSDLTAAIQKAADAVGKIPAGTISEADLDPVLAELNDLTTKIEALVPPPAPTA